MADELTALRDRQDKLEGRVERLESTVEREAMLRAKMDEDQSNVTATLKAHGRSLQALHDTQQDHTRRLEDHTRLLEDHTRLLEDHTRRLTRIEGDLGEVKEKLETVHIGVHVILDLLDTHLARKPKLPALTGLLRRPRPQGRSGKAA
jgi:chromosome segregation ATPase